MGENSTASQTKAGGFPIFFSEHNQKARFAGIPPMHRNRLAGYAEYFE